MIKIFGKMKKILINENVIKLKKKWNKIFKYFYSLCSSKGREHGKETLPTEVYPVTKVIAWCGHNRGGRVKGLRIKRKTIGLAARTEYPSRRAAYPPRWRAALGGRLFQNYLFPFKMVF